MTALSRINHVGIAMSSFKVSVETDHLIFGATAIVRPIDLFAQGGRVYFTDRFDTMGCIDA